MIKIISISLLFFVSNISCKENNAECKLNDIKTLFTTTGMYNGKVTGYAHYVLIKDFHRECMDSVTIINIAKKYIDTVKIKKPVEVVMFFSSDKDFINNEISQVMEDINKSCLVTINFNNETSLPEQFLFYDNKGNRIYWGNEWKPNG